MKDMRLSQKDIIGTHKDIIDSQKNRDKAIVKLAETKAITASQTVYNNCNNRKNSRDLDNIRKWVIIVI